MKPIGVIGLGTFGRFWAGHLAQHTPVVAYDRRRVGLPDGVQRGDLATAANQPVVVLAVPVQELGSVLKAVRELVRPNAVVMDVASVKAQPAAWMQERLPAECQIVATHPLFGPQSGAKGIAGLPMVTWPVRVNEVDYASLKGFFTNNLKLRVIELAPETHDREMAYVQALTFYVGRALGELDIPGSELKTATYQHMLDIRRIVAGDTPELFTAIQRCNPFAPEVRARLRLELKAIERELGRNQVS